MTCKQGRLQERHLIILLFGPLFFDIIRSARIENTVEYIVCIINVL